MHELSLMENVREMALSHARAHGAARIESITLRIGSLAGVEPDALCFAFEVVMAESIADQARLVIVNVQAECHCAVCAREFTAEDGCCECPFCGTISSQLLRGRELQLASLELS